MVKTPKKGRKLILIKSDLLDEVRKITAKEGKTFFSFTNEVFEQVLRAHKMNVSIADVVEFYRLMQVEKETGALIVPMNVSEYMTRSLYKEKKEELLGKWYESGLWYGKYLSAKFLDSEPLDIVERLMKNRLWNSTDFSVLKNGGQVKIRCMSPHFSSEHTRAFSKFCEGILHALDYETLKNECLKGIVLLHFKKKQ